MTRDFVGRLKFALWCAQSALRDRRGVSAIEFAFIAPVLILIYVGVVETTNLITLNRRVSLVAATAADLTAQLKTISNADLNDISMASSSILSPYEAKPLDASGPLKIVLSSVVADSDNKGKVAWSYASKGSGREVGKAYILPDGLTQPNSSVIVAEVTYNFTPVLGLNEIFSSGTFNMKRTFYARPRRSLSVAKN